MPTLEEIRAAARKAIGRETAEPFNFDAEESSNDLDDVELRARAWQYLKDQGIQMPEVVNTGRETLHDVMGKDPRPDKDWQAFGSDHERARLYPNKDKVDAWRTGKAQGEPAVALPRDVDYRGNPEGSSYDKGPAVTEEEAMKLMAQVLTSVPTEDLPPARELQSGATWDDGRTGAWANFDDPVAQRNQPVTDYLGSEIEGEVRGAPGLKKGAYFDELQYTPPSRHDKAVEEKAKRITKEEAARNAMAKHGYPLDEE